LALIEAGAKYALKLVDRRLADLVRARPSWQRAYELEGLTE
jgi:hypothetical protein